MKSIIDYYTENGLHSGYFLGFSRDWDFIIGSAKYPESIQVVSILQIKNPLILC